MADPTRSTIGLTVPGRPSTPCDGVPQHFRRFGNPLQQKTRTFPNGTTITFGKYDVIPEFNIGDPFYDQVQTIQTAEEEIREIRRKFEEIGLSSQSNMCGDEKVAVKERRGGHSSANSSVQDYVKGLGLGPSSHQTGTSMEAVRHDSGLLNGSQSRHHGRFSGKSRRNHDHSRMSRSSDAKILTGSDKAEFSILEDSVAKIPADTEKSSRQATKRTNKSQVLPEAPALQFNSFGANIPDASTTSGSVSAARYQTQSAIQSSSMQKKRTQKPAAQRRLEEISLHGCYLKYQPSSKASATKGTMSQTASATSGSVLQHSDSAASQRQEPFSRQMVHSGFSFNAAAADQSIAAFQQPTLMPIPIPGFYGPPPPNPDYYGPSFCMNDTQKAKIMSANGIKLPATYRPDNRYYHGPLHYFVPPVAAVIVDYVESTTNRPPSPLLPCHAMDTMLPPYALPPHVHIPGLLQGEIHVKECLRHYELMKEVLAVPGYMSHGEPPIVWYRILSSPHPRSQQPVWHPAVIDLYGKEEQYEHLLMRDVNFRNSNQKGVGRPENRLYRSNVVANEGTEQNSDTGADQGHQKTPVTTRNRDESENSVFFRNTRPPLNIGATYQYLGYTLKSKRHEEPDPEISPTQHSRNCKTRSSGKRPLLKVPKNNSASGDGVPRTSSTYTPKEPPFNAEKPSTGNTPLLDFDRKYTEEHGEGEAVDFALRDLGPPKVQGKTFNQAIGFTPPPERGAGASAPFGYPMNVYRCSNFRD